MPDPDARRAKAEADDARMLREQISRLCTELEAFRREVSRRLDRIEAKVLCDCNGTRGPNADDAGGPSSSDK